MEPSARAAQIKLLYSASALMLLHPFIAILAVLLLGHLYPNWAITTWFALICLVVALRFVNRNQYLQQTDQTRRAEYWGRRFVLGTVAIGCLWGLVSSALFLTPDPEDHIYAYGLLAGLGAITIVAGAAYLPAMLGLLIPMYVPLFVATLANPSSTSFLLSLLLMAFAIALLSVGYTINRWIANSLRLQIARLDLTNNLETASAELRQRAAILRAMLASTTELLRSFDLDGSMAAVLKLAGESTNVSRVSLFQNSVGSDGTLRSFGRYEWNAPGISAVQGDPLLQDIDFEAMRLGEWSQAMERGETRTAIVRLLENPAKALFEDHGVKSVLAVPVFVQSRWWGQIGFDDCDTERDWSAVEIDTLKTIAELVGAAIGHARNLDELATASRIIENSSTILYRIQPTPPFAITYVSRNTTRYGYTPEQFMSEPSFYMSLIHPEDRPKAASDLTRLAEGRVREVVGDYRIRQADGNYVWFEDHTRAFRDDGMPPTEIEGLLININERKTAEETITRFELTDRLTGLASRKSFMEQLTHTFVEARRGAASFAILYLDLDFFKDINEVLGHPAGDELLKVVAKRLTDVRRSTDDVARFGGDEFAVLQREVADPSDAGRLASRILEALSVSYNIGTAVHITASIGIAVYDAEVSGPEELMKRADLALYRAKGAGRNQYHFHSDSLDIEVRERVTLGEDLRKALERRELEMYYQPQVAITSGLINGLEALARWHHPTEGMILPGRFIPVAEKTGTIVPLGLWIVDDVCRQVALWRAEMPSMPTVAVNLSVAQLRPSLDFDRAYAEILRKHNLDASAIELELTESVLMEATHENSQMVERLRALGASIAIDDFGTGYSSMEYLRAYRVSHIKIAQEFIRDLETDPGNAAIVRATIGLARELGIKVIAEGVETVEQLHVLTKAGCESVQGYYFSRPVTASEAGRLLRKGRLTPAQSDRNAANIAGGADTGGRKGVA